ncbi:hypothetical protein [Streptomyces sp. NBC_01381]|uniref:hypothetical protein n=1 Tax=Streptomyces sp. NBC_01381 TaxID=2903845 RepID=UPI002B1DAC09|nr:hypothetical protein [Streptomyces sp. NBC_01381]
MPEPPYLAAVRASYDTVAADYAEVVKDPADLGCGPGKVTAYLAGIWRPWGPRRSASTCPRRWSSSPGSGIRT